MSSCDSSLPVVFFWYSAFTASRLITASDLKVWNLTASAPASAATSMSCSARSTEPLWLTPASAMTNTRSGMGMTLRMECLDRPHHVGDRIVVQALVDRQREGGAA